MSLSRRTFLMTGVSLAGAAALCWPDQARAATTLRYAHVQPETHATHVSALWMAERIAEQTDGQVDMQVFPGGQLGGPNEMIDALQVGDLDFAWISSAGIATSIPEFNVFSLSYLFEDDAHFRRALAPGSVAMQRLQEIVAASPYGIELAGMLGGVPRNLYNNLRPVAAPGDLEGVKLRVQSSQLEARVWSKLGALPQQLAWTEIYTGLQTGVINGAESSVDAYLSNNFNEVAPYLSMTRHQYLVMPLLRSKRTERKLGDAAPRVFEAGQASGEHNQALYQEGAKQALAEVKARGVEVNEPDTAPFRAAVADMVQEEAERYGAEDIVAAIQAAA